MKRTDQAKERQRQITDKLLSRHPKEFWEEAIDQRIQLAAKNNKNDGETSEKGKGKLSVDYQSLAVLGRPPTQLEAEAAVSVDFSGKAKSKAGGKGSTSGKNSSKAPPKNFPSPKGSGGGKKDSNVKASAKNRTPSAVSKGGGKGGGFGKQQKGPGENSSAPRGKNLPMKAGGKGGGKGWKGGSKMRKGP